MNRLAAILISTMGFSAVPALLFPLMTTTARAEAGDDTSVHESCSTVVKLFGAGIGNLDTYGSGTLISADGHLITVWNHLINSGYLTAVTSDGRRYQLDVIGTSAAHDLAVLRLRADDGDTFPFVDRSQAATDAVDVGSPVRAFSNMFHVATGNEPVSVVHGIIAAKAPLVAGFGRWKLPLKSDMLILDAITNNSGAAGGLLTDSSGQPLGMLGRELVHDETGTWVNYAVPLTTLNPVIDTLLTGGNVKDNVAKTETAPVSDRELTSIWGITLLPEVLRETPAWIDRIVPESTADKGGLRRGDLVVLVNNDVIQSGSGFRRRLATIRSGQRVTIIVNRRGALETIELRAP